MKTKQVSLRVPADIVEEFADHCRRMELSMNAAMAQGLKEWVRTQSHPGIDFRMTPTGRKPHVTGTGLTIAEIGMILDGYKSNVKLIRRDYPSLTVAQIQAAKAYVEAHRTETNLAIRAMNYKPPFAIEFRF